MAHLAGLVPAVAPATPGENGRRDDGTLSKSERLKGSIPLLEGRAPIARTRRSPKKLRLAKSPRTARAPRRRPPGNRRGGRWRQRARRCGRTTPRRRRQVGAAKKAWERGEVAKSLARAPRAANRVHDRLGHSDARDVLTAGGPGAARTRERSGCPGSTPITRGVQPTMYRGRLWTMRQFAGFGTPGGHQQALQVPHRRTA